MKILAIGDFHGKFQKKWVNLIKKEKIDLVVSNGDYLPFSYRKLWFKHCYKTDVKLWEVIGKERYKKLVLDDFKKGEEVLKRMNKLPVPVFTVLGNIDYPSADDVRDETGREKNWPYWDKKGYFGKLIKKYKNIKRFDYKFLKFDGWVFIGMRGHTFPGLVKSKSFRRSMEKLRKLFFRFRKENKKGKVIFVSHNVPYNTRLDKVGKKAHELVRGKHMGSKLTRRIIDKHQPLLAIGGHIHESLGKQRLKKSLCVNPGASHEGKAMIIEIGEDKKGMGKIREVKIVG